MGALYVILTALAYLYPRLRMVESELPDMIADDAEAPATESDKPDMAPHQPRHERLVGVGTETNLAS